MNCRSLATLICAGLLLQQLAGGSPRPAAAYPEASGRAAGTIVAAPGASTPTPGESHTAPETSPAEATASQPASCRPGQEPSTPQPPKFEFNLSSTVRNIPAGHWHDFHFVDITGGGSTRTIVPTDLLTPAEYVAVHQVLTTGTQTIRIGAKGSAVGGRFKLDKSLADAIGALAKGSSPFPAQEDSTLPAGSTASIVADKALKDEEYISVDGSSRIISGAAVVIGNKRARAGRHKIRTPGRR
ncbi:MAG TPA: hypothetical protein V6D08_13630 [Candidatus Obscuribacterales bacterium]